MAAVEKNVLKNYFKTGDKPTQAQFENLIDSFSMVNGNEGNVWDIESPGDAFINRQVKENRIGGDINFWIGTQAQYDAISTKSATTLYIIS